MGLPSNTTTSSDISAYTIGKAKGRMLDIAQYLMTLERFGQTDSQPANSGMTRVWNRFNAFARAVQPLAEGVRPAGQKVTTSGVTMSLVQLGDVYPLTDVIQDTYEDKALQQMTKRAGQAAGESVEEYRYNILKAGSNVFYANGVTSRSSVTSPPTRSDLRKIYRYFKKQGAREISEIIPASIKIATEPIMPSYFAVGSTDLLADLTDMSGFTPVKNYSDSMKALPGEVGAFEGFRFILSAFYTPWASAGASSTSFLAGGVQVSSAASCDVYPLLFFAEDAYGIVPLKGKESISFNVVNPNKVGHGNELGQTGFVSWKTYQGTVILTQAWMARLECSATASPE